MQTPAETGNDYNRSGNRGHRYFHSSVGDWGLRSASVNWAPGYRTQSSGSVRAQRMVSECPSSGELKPQRNKIPTFLVYIFKGAICLCYTSNSV